ncbi:transglutaminase domain-containing protein [Emticicia sp. 21SJ11W-3]|uniref:transglutaminase domain-containing protein n=1 Tax=Emticicia sp. 21SJ11W-3 TaxID=2916755 RepID=UPI00209D23B9|nr:transglutaminase domain-containing protein [Emticicia sp. 21SJ11W-3]UTA69878.1 hypothetical protein MB380_08695 [Emticicia sp. 21SJ11W-3]
MKKTFLLSLSFFISLSFNLIAQNHYQEGWKYLDNADIKNAINSFEKALKDKQTKEKAQLTLNLIYTVIGRPDKASELFKDFYDNSVDPSAELFAMWGEEGVIGSSSKHTPYQLALLKKVETDKRLKSKFDEIVKSAFTNHYIYSNNVEKLNEYQLSMNSIGKWSFLGPFDNLMNSGFNKDVGAVYKPKEGQKFQAKYNTEVTWFTPPISTTNGFAIKKYYFSSDNSIIYGQSFIESPNEQDVLMKFGNAGSLKIWLNDSLVHSEPERRHTEADYYQVKCHLNKGFNRILVQVGDYEESFAYFHVRFTDLNNQSIYLNAKPDYQAYQKYKGTITAIPFFAVEELKKKSKGEDLLYELLLAKTYLRALDINAAEEVLYKLYETHPDNYLILRELINFYRSSDNTTEQNKTYESYKELYPEDYDIVANDLKEAVDQRDKSKIKEYAALIKEKFPYAEKKIMLSDIILLGINEDVNNLVLKVDEVYAKYPEDHEIVELKYKIQKSVAPDPKKTNEIIEKYLKNNFNFQLSDILKADYVDQGRIEDAIKKLQEEKKLVLDPLLDRKIVNLLSRKRDYEGAIKVCLDILKMRPSDYETLQDLAALHNMINDKKNAVAYYEQALKFFPFSFEYNEKIRELKGEKPTFDVVIGINAVEAIKDYEKNFSPKIKAPYDIVNEKKSFIVFKTRATASRNSYIIKINQERAIEEWQKIQLSGDANDLIQVNEVKTIKKNGSKLDAERNGDEWVFTNLEVGDYIYVDYLFKQTNGSSSSSFIYDSFALNSFRPVYKREYTVFAQEGLSIKDTVINANIKPQKSKLEGFDIYNWKSVSPENLKDENYTPPFSDVGTTVQISLGNTWADIAGWYSDLSEKQAQPDFTIHSIVKSLFDNKKYTDEEKARIIYDFVCKNIQYSSIDFRQGSYIPQKASTIYHTRLGDCKDVSTLYASIARAAGLDVNLVLINTRDNGKKNVVLPSLNFNHCIVKVNLKSGSKYLELTDTNLPFGYLYFSHKGASILEIPVKNVSNNISLGSLKLNKGYDNKIIRNGTFSLTVSNNVTFKKTVVKTGNQASNMCDIYYYLDEDKRKEEFKKSITEGAESPTKLNWLKFEKLEPRKDTAIFSYEYTVENEIKKAGSFRTLKLPFTDYIAKLDIFDDSERVFDFDYNFYERVDYYDETLIINFDGGIKLLEMPENVHLTFKGNIYDLSFTKINDKQLKIRRTYTAEAENIKPEDFSGFKTFITKAIEADNTTLVMK